MKNLHVIGAVTNLGLKPYDDCRPRGVDRAAAVYRELGLIERLGATDRGDVVAQPYRDLFPVEGRVRNDDLIADYAHRLAAAIDDDAFPLIVGGDCSILLGSLLGMRRRGRVGLAFIDGHSDFATLNASTSKAAAGMDLALATGYGDTPLARLAGEPLVREEDVVLIGRRDQYEEHLLEFPIAQTKIRDVSARDAQPPTGEGFFIHVDADVLDSKVMPAVDSPEEGGLTVQELVDVLRPLVHDPRALGMELTIYDPELDPDRRCGRLIVGLLEQVFAASPV